MRLLTERMQALTTAEEEDGGEGGADTLGGLSTASNLAHLSTCDPTSSPLSDSDRPVYTGRPSSFRVRSRLSTVGKCGPRSFAQVPTPIPDNPEEGNLKQASHGHNRSAADVTKSTNSEQTFMSALISLTYFCLAVWDILCRFKTRFNSRLYRPNKATASTVCWYFLLQNTLGL